MRSKLFRSRCRNCRARRSLAKHPNAYSLGHTPPCLQCGLTERKQRDKYGFKLPKHLMGENLVWKLDEHRQTKEKQNTCTDDCMNAQGKKAFPHRWGSPGCKHREEFLLEQSSCGSTVGRVDPNEPCGF